MILERRKGIPIVMYHSVGEIKPDWIWSFLTIPVEKFENHVQVLRKKGYTTLNLHDVHNHLLNGEPVPNRSVVFTFDDGYLDNWVYAYPILKKYGYKGTIFVNPEFVDPCPTPRPNLSDVWQGKIDISALPQMGFLAWEEMRCMERDGTMDIQCHAMSHTWYFSEDKIVDFRHPGDPYVWMDWNNHLDNKHKYLSDDWAPNMEYGAPVYVHKKSLEGPRLIPSEELKDALIDFVNKNGGKNFFKKNDWRDVLFKKAEDLKKAFKYKAIREDLKTFNDRLRYELRDSKSVLEKKLNKKIDYLCWPGGGLCDEAIQLVKTTYSAVTLPSRNASNRINAFGEDPFYMRRIGAPSEIRKQDIRYYGGLYLHLLLCEYGGSQMHRYLRQVVKLFKLIGMYVNRY